MKSPSTRNFETIHRLQFNLPYFREESLSEKLQLLSKPHKISTIFLYTWWSFCHEILINYLWKLSLNSCKESGVFYIFMSCVNSLGKCVRINSTWHLKLLHQNIHTPNTTLWFSGHVKVLHKLHGDFHTTDACHFTLYIPTSLKIFLIQKKYRFS